MIPLSRNESSSFSLRYPRRPGVATSCGPARCGAATPLSRGSSLGPGSTPMGSSRPQTGGHRDGTLASRSPDDRRLHQRSARRRDDPARRPRSSGQHGPLRLRDASCGREANRERLCTTPARIPASSESGSLNPNSVRQRLERHSAGDAGRAPRSERPAYPDTRRVHQIGRYVALDNAPKNSSWTLSGSRNVIIALTV